MRAAVSICLNATFPTAIYWGRDLRLLYNDAWAVIPGDRHPWALGRPAAVVWQDIWPIVGPQFAEVLATGQGFSAYDQMLPMLRNGRIQETYWNYSFTPIRDDDGEVVGVFNQGNETSERVLRQRRQEFKLRLQETLRPHSDPRAIMEAVVEAIGQHLGANRVGYAEITDDDQFVNLRTCYVNGVAPLSGLFDLTTISAQSMALQRQGITQYRDDIREDPTENVETWTAIETRAYASVPLIRSGRLTASLYANFREPHSWTSEEIALIESVANQTWDIVERARAEAALRESEEFSRSVVESSGDCIKVLELDGTLAFLNENGRCLMEIDDFSSVCGKHWLTLWPKESIPEVEAALATAKSNGVGRFTAFCPTAKGTPKWWDVVVTAVQGADRKPMRLVSISRDITDQRHADETRRLLLNELDHRVKNLFAITTSMVTVTARSSSSVEELRDNLKGRLYALATAHELIRPAINAAARKRASLEDLVAGVLNPHVDKRCERPLTVSGPDISIGERAVTNLAMILHELATNAAKYGALSHPGGHLMLKWQTSSENLELEWDEHVVSRRIEAPTSQGFGSRLASETTTRQFGGSIAYDWRPQGVRIAISLPLAQL